MKINKKYKKKDFICVLKPEFDILGAYQSEFDRRAHSNLDGWAHNNLNSTDGHIAI